MTTTKQNRNPFDVPQRVRRAPSAIAHPLTIVSKFLAARFSSERHTNAFFGCYINDSLQSRTTKLRAVPRLFSCESLCMTPWSNSARAEAASPSESTHNDEKPTTVVRCTRRDSPVNRGEHATVQMWRRGGEGNLTEVLNHVTVRGCALVTRQVLLT